jgi:group I intron endonuclease
LAGVYYIVNLINEKSYVGSAITNKLHIRFHKHLFGLSGNKHLANAVKKYGINNFAYILLETIPYKIDIKNNKDILDLENKYIKLLMPKYNKTLQAGNTTGYNHTVETILKMKKNYSLRLRILRSKRERKNKIGNLNKGKNLSIVTKSLMSKKALARDPMSNKTRAFISANSAKAKFYNVSDLNNLNNITLRTLVVVAKYCNCSIRTVTRALNGNGIIKKKLAAAPVYLDYNIKFSDYYGY